MHFTCSGSAGILSSQINSMKVRKETKIRKRYDQVPYLPQDTTREINKNIINITNKSQEVSPFPAGDHKSAVFSLCRFSLFLIDPFLQIIQSSELAIRWIAFISQFLYPESNTHKNNSSNIIKGQLDMTQSNLVKLISYGLEVLLLSISSWNYIEIDITILSPKMVIVSILSSKRFECRKDTSQGDISFTHSKHMWILTVIKID